MALLTPMTLAEAQAVGSAYGIDVVRVEGVAQGINSNFVLHLAGGGRVFARACEQCAEAAARAQAELLSHLAAAQVPTPRPLSRLDGTGASSVHRGKPTLLFPFCEGHDRCQRSVRPCHAEQVGAALARVHGATREVDYPAAHHYDLADLQRRLDGLLARAELELQRSELEVMARRLAALARQPLAGAAPETVVHGDLFRDNVLWKGDRLSALLDFEFAARDRAGYDLMVTMLAWCFGDGFERELACALVAGYAAHQPLDGATRRSLFPQAQRAALRFAVSRVEDYELRPREAIRYKDFRRFLARLEGLDEVGPEPFCAWLGLD